MKDEARSIERLLGILERQELGGRSAEVIVVDSGSTDGTVDVVRASGVRLIQIPAASFTFGGSLNTGCAAAAAPVIAALSAHAFPRDEHWLAGMLAPFEDERVAAVHGLDVDWDGQPLRERVVQDEAHSRAHPYWGYGNPAGAFRAELWRQRPFREDMPGTEDREWAWHWLQRGWVVVIDPALHTEHYHDDDTLRDTYRRAWVGWRGSSMYLDIEPYRARDLVREWWTGKRGWPSHFRARVSRKRAARLLGKYQGLAPTRGRRGARGGGPAAAG